MIEKKGEVWKDIKDYEGLYQVSNLGRIKSLEKEVHNRWGTGSVRKERIMNPVVGTNGYYKVSLHREAVIKWFSVHRLMAMAFINNPDNKTHINHKDCNRTNNSLDNLEWCTHAENIKHAWDNGMCERSRIAVSNFLSTLHKNKDNRLRNYKKLQII